jgi:hypothetical protein
MPGKRTKKKKRAGADRTLAALSRKLDKMDRQIKILTKWAKKTARWLKRGGGDPPPPPPPPDYN